MEQEIFDHLGCRVFAKFHQNITCVTLEGQGSTGELTSYAMPGSSLYMMQVDENSLNQIKSAIKNTMEGN